MGILGARMARTGLVLLAAAAAWCAFLPEANAAPAQLYANPFRQSPVRGEPGDLLMIAGSGFSAGDTIVYRRIWDTTQPLVHPPAIPQFSNANWGVAPIVSLENVPDSLTVRLPDFMESGASYALWVVSDAREWSAGIKINDARPLWFTPDVMYRKVSPQGLSRQLKVVGRNLEPQPCMTTTVRLRGPKTYTLTAMNDGNPNTAIEHYVARVNLPSNLLPGVYQVDVRRDSASWVTVPGQTLTVLPDPVNPPIFPVSSFGCMPSDGLDDTFCILRAKDAAEASGGGIVALGPGTWELLDPTIPGVDPTFGIVLPRGVSLIGAGASATKIVKGPDWNVNGGALVYRAVFTVQGKNVIRRIGFEDTRQYQPTDWTAPFFLLGKFPWSPDPGPTSVDDVTFTENVFARPFMAIGDGGFPLRHLHITHNEFGAYHDAILLGGNRYITDFKFQVEDSIISHNVFKPGGYIDSCIYQGAIATHLGAARRLDFSHNIADGHAQDYLDGSLPGWRAAFFWHMNNNHEMVLVSQNMASCTGDKAGDGEAIAYDNNANTFGFDAAKTIAHATSTTVKVSAADGHLLQRLQNGRPVPSDYYNEHWIQIANGVGLGQARKIVSYEVDSVSQDVTFTVSPAWDVIPEPGRSTMTVAREFWQVYTVDNLVDMRGCSGARSGAGSCNNLNGLKQCGIINFGGMTSDSTAEGNIQYDASGILITPAYSIEHAPHFTATQRFAYFVDVRSNTLSGEADYDSTCSWAGVSLWHGAASGPPETMPPSPVVLGYGVSVAKNSISHADGIRGGAVVFADTWWEPEGSRMYLNTLIYQNEISNLLAPSAPTMQSASSCSGSFMCGDDPVREVGVHIRLPLVHSTVISDNTFSDVQRPLVDNGTRTVHVR